MMYGFSSRLKELRLAKGYTQAELAEKLGISPSAVGMYEQGRREPDGDLLMEISRLFSVSADYLLSKEEGGPKEVKDALLSLRGRLKETGGLMFKGIPLDEADTEKLFDAMLLAANIMLKDKESDTTQ